VVASTSGTRIIIQVLRSVALYNASVVLRLCEKADFLLFGGSPSRSIYLWCS
jgi:hypothetical protein